MTNTMTRQEMTAVDSWLAAASEVLFKTTQTLLGYCKPRVSRRRVNGEFVDVETWRKVDEFCDWQTIDKATAQRERALLVIETCDDLWRANGCWNRFFLVVNSNGHVHRERSCSTCFPTTMYNWLVELAGADEAEMVRDFGTDACTVCFPSAPTLPGWGSSRTQREKEAARAARAAAKQAKIDADKARNELENPVEIPDAGWDGQTKIVKRLTDARWELNTSFLYSKKGWDAALQRQLATEISKKTGKSADAILKHAKKLAERGY